MTFTLTIKNHPSPYTVKVLRQEDSKCPQPLAKLQPGEEATVTGWAGSRIIVEEV
jgi:hypothetical protein